jgi:signal transduction histidine kinase/ligand-binding sensor domain-containing protein
MCAVSVTARRAVPRVMLAATLCAVRAQAQAPPTHTAARDWVLDGWSSDQGLPQNTITSIVQSPDGYLWLGTYGGLVRFDGVRFTAFTTREHPALGSDRITALALARDGTMWIGTDRGTVRFRDGVMTEWTDGSGRPRGATNAMRLDSAGGVWVAAQVDGLGHFDGRRWETFETRGLHAGYAGDVAVDGRGNVWVHRGDNRLYLRRAGAAAFEPADGRDSLLQPMLVDGAGAVWFNSRRGPTRWEEQAPTPRSIDFRGFHLADDRRGGVWAAGESGFLHVDASRLRRTPVPPFTAAPMGDVRHLFVDREGTLWIGTGTRGLMRLRPRLFTVYLKEDGLASEQITAVMRDRRGRLWIGSSCGPTSMMIGKRLSPSTMPGCLFALAQAPDGAIWGAPYAGGVQRIGPDGTITKLRKADGLVDDVALAIHADADSSVWIGTLGGVSHYRNGAFTNYTTAAGLPSNQVHMVTRDRRGALWIGTEGGLARLDGSRFSAWTTRDGLPHDNVRAVYQDADGIWWIGTYGGGLARFDGTRFVTIDAGHGLYENMVSSIIEDANGYLWMSGNRGIYRVHRRVLEDFARGAMPQVVSVGYGPSDGLITTETNGGFQPSAWADTDGRLWYATIRGLATIDPRAAVPASEPPSVVIEAVRVDGTPLPVSAGQLRLPGGGRYVEVQYTGLTSIAPDQLVFRYRLEGVDTAWQYVGDRRTAYFAGLPPGSYTFVVSAAGRDARWNAAGARLAFVVPTPWYSRLWFRGSVVLALVGAAGLVIRRRIERLHEQHRVQREYARLVLAGQEQERGRLAGELHDSLGQDLLVMKNRAALALRIPDIDPALRAHIEEISSVASSAVQNAREISHGLRPYQLDRLGLAAALRDLGERASQAAGIAVTVEIGDVESLLDQEATIHVFRIVQEALNNVLKHADATRASIILAREPGGVRARVTDDGRGVNPEKAAGFGMSGISQRVQLLGGRVEIRSAPGAGLTVDVFLPTSPYSLPTAPVRSATAAP